MSFRDPYAGYFSHRMTFMSLMWDIFGTPVWADFKSKNIDGRPRFYSWQLLWRCPCGSAYHISNNDGNYSKNLAAIDSRWLCADCGRDAATLLKCVGRWWGSEMGGRAEWLPWSRLPKDIQQFNRKELASLTSPETKEQLEDEIHKRVKAEFEVEQALQQSLIHGE